jgi:lactate dehydrogenase-like 2-hydroxyacid dehydrogenase
VSAGHVYVTRRLPPGTMALLETLPCGVRVHDSDDPPSREQLLDGVRGAVGIITLLTDRVDEELLDTAGPRLRVVANYAVGHDNIEVDAARRRGVVVCNTPGVLDEATADLTMALVLATARRVVEADRWLRSGAEWIWSPRLFTGLDISAGARLGIIGLGRIGLAVARRAEAFRMEVVAASTRRANSSADTDGVRRVPLDELLATSDVVSLHCPLTSETRHLIDATRLASMRRTAILINTARGPIVQEAALLDALRDGTIGGAGLDVFEHEPRVSAALLELDNVVVVPHIASAGLATREAMGRLVVGNVADVLGGVEPRTPVVMGPAGLSRPEGQRGSV